MIESVNKIGLPLKILHIPAKKHVPAAMINHALVMTDKNTTVNHMYVTMVLGFATMTGLSPILEIMDVKNLVIFARYDISHNFIIVHSLPYL